MNKEFIFRFREGSFLLGSRTYIMGIINATPDSFSDGGDNFLPENALKTATEMQNSGADILDIGGQSTRPGATLISPEEEWARLEKVLTLILNATVLPVSVDTFYPEVARKALEMGAHIINDVSGTVNPKMAEVVKEYGAGWILMHSGEESDTDISGCVHNRLLNMLNTAVSLGVNSENICLDAGIGFGKNMEQNLTLISETNRVKVDGNAYLIGASRKRFLGAAMGNNDLEFKQRDYATLAVNTVGILGGADILRVHNVKATVQAALVTDKIREKDRRND